jgi:polynucleotide 5'-kinase involved in rRNA processing
MIKNIDKGNTLIVKGPARVTLLEGELDVLGKIFQSKTGKTTPNKPTNDEDENVLIIPSAQCYPLYATDSIQLEIYTNNEENLKEIKENSISATWVKIKDEIIDLLKKERDVPLKIMVLGFSSGKTTLIKYLANNFIKEGLKGGYLDSDLGQQIIYIPTTINLGTIKEYIISSENIQSEKTIFIGATFPKGDYKYIVSHSCRKMIDDYIAENKDIDFVLIDTDGWIKTEAGIVYKSFFIKSVNPDILIAFHDEEIEELTEIERNAASQNKERKTYIIEDGNEHFYERDKDERRFLRQSQFSKKFEDFRKISIPLNDIKFIKTDYNKENDEILEQEVDIRDLVNLPYHYVIIGLLTEDSKLIEIGLLFTINVDKNYILLYSNISYKQQLEVKKILLGSLRLSTKGNHQGYLYL